MNRIDKKFQELKKRKKKAFIAFITAGYPDLKITKNLVLEFSQAGVDIIELGVPFSDPLADGPIIQQASEFALKKGVNLAKILNLVKDIRRHTSIPICLMTYYNPVFCFPEDKFISQAARAGVDGIIIPDLPPEEGSRLIKSALRHKLDTIFFLSPTSPLERMKYISRVSQGFIYYVSLTGVTGAREKLPSDIKQNLRTIKKYTNKPLCVGFGISTSAQVKEICKFADGVIVGSAIIKKIKDNLVKKDLSKIVRSFVENLKNV